MIWASRPSKTSLDRCRSIRSRRRFWGAPADHRHAQNGQAASSVIYRAAIHCRVAFCNFTERKEKNFFVAAITDDLPPALSRLAGSFVTAHNSAFTKRDNPADIKQIGRDL